MPEPDDEDAMPERFRRTIATWPGIQNRAAHLRRNPTPSDASPTDVAWRIRTDPNAADDIDRALRGSPPGEV